MPFEIVSAPHLQPHVCIVCGCSKQEPHVFVPTNQAWEYNYPFICKTCVQEMATELGIAGKETVEKVVEVPRPPTLQEMSAYIADNYLLAPLHVPGGAPPALNEPVETCACGAEFRGPTAKAKLGSHKRNCAQAKEAAANAG